MSTDQVTCRNIYVYTYTFMHAIIVIIDTINFKESMEELMGEFRGRKMRRNGTIII